MAKRTITLDLLAKNKTGPGFKGAGKDADSFGRSLSKIGAGIGIAFAAGAAVMVAAGAQAVEALKRLEVIGAQTSAVIKSTGGAAGVTAEQVRALADSLERATATESEAIQEGANLLLTFTNIRNGATKNERVFDRATELMVDMARAMGTDAAGSAMQLGKALNDPVAGVAALTRVGVQFTDEQKDMIRALSESGDLLGAQQVILNELETQFGGSGEAYAATLAGQIDTLNHNMGGLAESVMISLMPALQDFVEWGNSDLVPFLEDFADWFVKDGVPAIEGFADKLGEMAENGTLVPSVVGGLTAMTLGMLGLNAAMAANPIGLVVLALAALATQFTYVMANLEAFKFSAGDVSWGKPFLLMFTGWFGIVAAFAQNWETIWFLLRQNFTGTVNGMIAVINGLLTPLEMILQVINTIAGTNFSIRIAPLVGPSLRDIATPLRSSQTPTNTSQRGGMVGLAAGGIVRPTPGGTQAVIGEGGQSEAVIPLTARNLAMMGGGGTTVVVNAPNFVGSKSELARVVTRAVEDARRAGSISRGAAVA